MCHSQRYQEAYQTIPQDLQPIFDRWINAARAVPGGEDIVQNIFSEQHLSESIFGEFLTFISQYYRDRQGKHPENQGEVIIKTPRKRSQLSNLQG